MREFTSFKSRGQTLLLVAVAAVAIVAFVALAVDGGTAYSLRRDAQSASDAGAIAGTWAMISLPPGADPQAPVLREANKAAEANGVPDTNGTPGDVINTHILAYYVDQDGNRIDFPELHDAGGLPRPSAARGVEVVSTITQTTFFARAIGTDQVQATAPATARFKIDGGVLPIAVNEYWTGSQDQCPYANCAPPYSYVRNPVEEAPFRTDDGGLTWARNICADPYNNNTCQGPYEGYGENYGKAFAILGADAKPLGGSMNPRSGVVLNCRYDAIINTGAWHELTGDNAWANPGQCAIADGQGGADMEAIIRAGGYDRVPLPAALNEPPTEFYEDGWTYCWQEPYNEDNCFNWPEEDREQPYEVLQFLSGARAAQMARTMYDEGRFIDGRFAPGERIVIMVYNGYVMDTDKDTAVLVGYFGAIIVGYGNNFDPNCEANYNPTPGEWETYDDCITGQPNTVYAVAAPMAPLVINPEKLLDDFLPKKVVLIR